MNRLDIVLQDTLQLFSRDVRQLTDVHKPSEPNESVHLPQCMKLAIRHQLDVSLAVRETEFTDDLIVFKIDKGHASNTLCRSGERNNNLVGNADGLDEDPLARFQRTGMSN